LVAHLLLCANYLMHACYRRTLILDAGGFDPRTDGAQDWDLEFRCVERTQRIAHIPKSSIIGAKYRARRH
jgi:hypothetical protein